MQSYAEKVEEATFLFTKGAGWVGLLCKVKGQWGNQGFSVGDGG